MNNSRLIILSLLILFNWACQNEGDVVVDEAYRAEIETWRAERLARLKAPDGWPTLAGLFRLKEDENTFGSGPDNDLVFPEKAPAKMGVIFLEGDSLVTRMAEGVAVKMGDSTVTQVTTTTDEPALLEYESLQWYPIERGGQYFIRLRDTLHPAREELHALPYFPIDPQWRIRAKFVPFDPPRTISIRNVLDMDISQECEGKFQFEREDQTLELWVLDGGPDEYFLIFADETTGRETYGGGRYMYAPRPDSTGRSILDFNKAYNPPCVFTAYATCLLPPPQNRLPVAVQAGEMMYGEEH
jgi:uncharacterized protein (DUF1684 family)